MFTVISAPNLLIRELTRPEEPNRLDIRENMMTQLMKCGSVVRVCTHFWKRVLLISLRKMANSIGSGMSR